MAKRNLPSMPPVWDQDGLIRMADESLKDFVQRRLDEPASSYVAHLRRHRHSLKVLFGHLARLDPATPDPAIIAAILTNEDLESSLRYVAGPPLSSDDLGVLVTRGPKRLSRTAATRNPVLAAAVLALICSLADSGRFPWLAERRRPRPFEIKLAIRATASLHAAQTLQTERRAYGREVERRLAARLEAQGFVRARAPGGGKIIAPKDMPASKGFYGECSLRGRRTDLLIGLPDGRHVAVEAKDSSSVVNSVKRVLNDTAAKAKHWRQEFGNDLIPVALLSGVFGLDTLVAAQEAGLYLAWSHDLDGFTGWLEAQFV